MSCILGILASVAIPRLASTRADAEISAAVANLRTLLSDASGYYVVKGEFGTAPYKEFTNVPLRDSNGNTLTTTVAVAATANAYLPAGDVKNCIGINFVEKNLTTKAPAHIKFTKGSTTGVCAQVLDAPAVKSYVDNSISYTDTAGAAKTITNAMAIGSNTSVYDTLKEIEQNQPTN